jgi:hypothetical protein
MSAAVIVHEVRTHGARERPRRRQRVGVRTRWREGDEEREAGDETRGEGRGHGVIVVDEPWRRKGRTTRRFPVRALGAERTVPLGSAA